MKKIKMYTPIYVHLLASFIFLRDPRRRRVLPVRGVRRARVCVYIVVVKILITSARARALKTLWPTTGRSREVSPAGPAVR